MLVWSEAAAVSSGEQRFLHFSSGFVCTVYLYTLYTVHLQTSWKNVYQAFQFLSGLLV